jgi:hypothetical protein
VRTPHPGIAAGVIIRQVSQVTTMRTPGERRQRFRVQDAGGAATSQPTSAQFCGPRPPFDGARRQRPAAESPRSPRPRSRTRDRTEARQRQSRARVLHAECSWTTPLCLRLTGLAYSGGRLRAGAQAPRCRLACWSPGTPVWDLLLQANLLLIHAIARPPTLSLITGIECDKPTAPDTRTFLPAEATKRSRMRQADEPAWPRQHGRER